MFLKTCLLPEDQTNHLRQLILEHGTFKAWVGQFADNTTHNTELLHRLFLFLTPMVKDCLDIASIKTRVQTMGCNLSDLSHLKQVFFDVPTEAGALCFELIYFTGNAWTALHMHPEYVMDEIIAGTLEEHLYQRDETSQGSYSLIRKCQRPTGDTRVIYDPEGSPHNVRGSSDGCLILCLYLGTQVMQTIESA